MKALKGVYLVIDPKQPWEILFKKLKAALEGGINIVQIWNHWHDGVDFNQKLSFILRVKKLANVFDVPLIMHEDWRLAQKGRLDGVHFDIIPEQFGEVKQKSHLKHIGITVGNDMELIRWAAEHDLSYISFCAIFPSSSVSSCEIVDQDKICEARKIIDCPIFISGGLTSENLGRLRDLPFDGIAVISGILNANNPKQAVTTYIQKLDEIRINKLTS